MATGCELSDSQQEQNFLFSQLPDRLWDSPSLLSNGYRGTLFLGVNIRGVDTTHLHLVPRLRVVELLRGAVLIINHRDNFTLFSKFSLFLKKIEGLCEIALMSFVSVPTMFSISARSASFQRKVGY
jgi:hypothetical protein